MTKTQSLMLAAFLLAACGVIAMHAMYDFGDLEGTNPPPSPNPAIEKSESPKQDLAIPPVKVFPDEVRRDPLWVNDPDARYGKDRREPPAGFREKWKLNGIVIAGQDPTTGEDIPACSFEGNDRFYTVGDRLDGTQFVVNYINLDSDAAFVLVEGKDGLLVRLSMLDMNRYK